MIYEYAITPEVFLDSTYTSPEVADLRLSDLKTGLTCNGVIKNLYDGAWEKLFAESNFEGVHPRGKELLKKVKQQGRLCFTPTSGGQAPESDLEWCSEALAVFEKKPFEGIVTTPKSKELCGERQEVASIEKLGSTSWWHGGQASVTLKRKTSDYLNVLDSILHNSRSLMFIDPHIDPTRYRYAEFYRLLEQCGTCCEIVEIHRVCYTGSRGNRKIYTDTELEEMFRYSLKKRIPNLTVEIFVWDDFHDRHLISNLIGVQMQNGFDIDEGTTRWGRYDRKDSDSVQREFDPASGVHGLIHRFTI